MEEEIARVIAENPHQRMPALRALTILRARKAAQTTTLQNLSELLADLPEGKGGFLAETRRVRELADAIARQQLRVDTTSRPYFREIEARNLVAEIRNFQGRVSGMNEPLAIEFRKASENWLELADAQVATATEAARAEPTPQVFRAGDPVAWEREAFVPRFRLLEELEGQIMLGPGCPACCSARLGAWGRVRCSRTCRSSCLMECPQCISLFNPHGISRRFEVS
jgi:hypothetical protein